MEPVNILIVDDQPGKLLSHQAILDELGENLVMVQSGREALQFLLRHDCALILLDVVMPVMDGFETATLIRQHPRLEHTPIIFVTALSTSDMDRLKGYELGAVDYVFAPVVPEILRAKASVFVELHRKRHELALANAQLQVEIAQRQRAQEQALQAERLAAIGEMVTGLAHESRNALQQIQSAVEMLTRRLENRPELPLVAEIQKAQDRMYHLLEDVRGYAAPLRLKRDAQELPKLWREAWRQLAHQHQSRDAQLVEEGSGADASCELDGFAVERVFRNILENSLGACVDPVRIAIGCTDEPFDGHPGVRITVRDNGPGLNRMQRDNIFVPFFTTKSRGTGLGMAIAKRVVEAHGGRIALGDTNGAGGTEIIIQFPRGMS
jgi:signal transduction histidine kinase